MEGAASSTYDSPRAFRGQPGVRSGRERGRGSSGARTGGRGAPRRGAKVLASFGHTRRGQID